MVECMPRSKAFVVISNSAKYLVEMSSRYNGRTAVTQRRWFDDRGVTWFRFLTDPEVEDDGRLVPKLQLPQVCHVWQAGSVTWAGQSLTDPSRRSSLRIRLPALVSEEPEPVFAIVVSFTGSDCSAALDRFRSDVRKAASAGGGSQRPEQSGFYQCVKELSSSTEDPAVCVRDVLSDVHLFDTSSEPAGDGANGARGDGGFDFIISL